MRRVADVSRKFMPRPVIEMSNLILGFQRRLCVRSPFLMLHGHQCQYCVKILSML